MAESNKMFAIEKFDGTNYAIWRMAMHQYLVYNDYWYTIDDKKSKPSSGTKPPEFTDTPPVLDTTGTYLEKAAKKTAYDAAMVIWKTAKEASEALHETYNDEKDIVEEWTRDVEKAYALLLFNCTQTMYYHFEGKDAIENRALAVWEELEKEYGKPTMLGAFTLYKELMRFTFTNSDTLRAQMDRFQRLRLELANAGITIEEWQIALTILFALPDSFENFRTMICGQNEIKTLTTSSFLNKMYEEEDRRGERATPRANFASRSGAKPAQKRKGKCNYCNTEGHWAAECKKKQKDEGSGSNTPNNKSGRSKGKKAGKKHWKKKGSKAAVATTAFAFAAGLSGTKMSMTDIEYLVDSGCSEHMTNCRTDFTSYQAFPQVRDVGTAIADCPMKAVGSGTCTFEYMFKGEKRSLQIHRVLHVPELAH